MTTPPRRRLLAVAAGIATVSAAILTGCASEADPDNELSTVTVVDERLAFSLQIDQPGIGIETVRATGDTSPCPQVRYSLRNDTAIEAVASNCTIPPNANRQIGNGRHGTYRTVEDVAHPIGLVQQQTKLGPAAVFSQEYYECTNSCKRWNEPIAIITLNKPVKAAYPTLVVRIGRSDASAEDLANLLGGLASASAQ